ncbi:MAG: S-layer homology domain-containing protein [Clostridia bacterium]|nr:S-layer homology domain-containing protein [Clostridia bacterium]
MRKFLSFLLALTMIALASAAAPAPAARAEEGDSPFGDVDPGDWYYDAVTYVYEHGIMIGLTPGTFSVSSATTRAQLVTILSRLDNADVGGMGSGNGFTDVKSGDWYADAVGWASSLGIVRGYTDGTFRPGSPVLRQELCAMLSRFAEHQGMFYDEKPLTDGFSDGGKVPDWAKAPVEQMRRAGIVGGNEKREFSPASTATRAEIAAMIMRYLKNDPMYDRMANVTNYAACRNGMIDVSLPFRDRVIGSGTSTSLTNQLLPQMGLSTDTYEILLEESWRENLVNDTDCSFTGDVVMNNRSEEKSANMGVARLAIKNLVTGEVTPYKSVRLWVMRYLGEENIDPDDWEPGLPDGALDAMIDASVYSTGDVSRYARFFEKAESGEDLTVALIGGSITARASGGDLHCYAKQFFNRIVKTYPRSDFTYVNAGIGGTGSFYGSFRLESNVLIHKPDLFVIEFATNDSPTNENREAFETIVRRVMSLDNDPAVLILLVGVSNGENCVFMKELADRYGLAVSDCKAAADLALSEVWMYPVELGWDGVHPREWFHSFMALSLVRELDMIREKIGNASANELVTKPLPERLTPAVYENLTALLPGRDEPDSNKGFTVSEGLFKYDKGWQASDGTAELKFKIRSTNVYVTLLDNEGVTVSVDGIETRINDYEGAFTVFSGTAPEDHTVVITPVGDGSLASVTGILFN